MRLPLPVGIYMEVDNGKHIVWVVFISQPASSCQIAGSSLRRLHLYLSHFESLGCSIKPKCLMLKLLGKWNKK